MIKCTRRQATNQQKFKKFSTIVFSFLLVEAEAIGVEVEAVDEITASASLL